MKEGKREDENGKVGEDIKKKKWKRKWKKNKIMSNITKVCEWFGRISGKCATKLGIGWDKWEKRVMGNEKDSVSK